MQAISKLYQKTAKMFGALKIKVTNVFLFLKVNISVNRERGEMGALA